MNTQSQSRSEAPHSGRRLIRTAAVADAAGTLAAPGAILLGDGRIIAAGSPKVIGDVAGAIVEDLPREIVIPALVNTHAHLDLTHIGPIPLEGGFTEWVDRVRAERARSPDDIAASVMEGVRLARAGGTAMVGDIAGVRSTVPTQALRGSGLGGASFLEVFGVGRTQAAAIEFLRSAAATTPQLAAGVRLGVQPHAPYSCGPEVYRTAASLGLPLSTHLAETRDELEFVATGSGPLAEMLKRIGVWDDSITGFGMHPIDHVARSIARSARPMLAAHLNYLDDRHLGLLARDSISVAYCPRASAYFGHTGHRYRDMLAAGANVALGTDSMLCLDTPDRIGVLDEMRLLHRRDAADPLTLLAMATVNGAKALGVRDALVTIRAGESAGLLALPIDRTPASATDALAQALQRDDPPRWLLGPVAGKDAWFR